MRVTRTDTDHSSEVRQSRISRLRDKRSQLSETQWENILRFSLLRQRIPILDIGPVEKLEVVATIAGDTLAIHFRNNISGITQKLGEILLKQDEDQEIDAISWCGTAIQRSTSLETEVQDLTTKYDQQSKTIEKLNKQLGDLIEAKREHENSLLEKFRALLNNKKIKIRDQQRLLAGANVDPKQTAKVNGARKSSKPSHKPEASRAGKRKANDLPKASQSSEEEDSFEPKTDTRAQTQRPKEESDGSEQINTPEGSDNEVTEDDSDDDLDSAPHQTTLPSNSDNRDGDNAGIGNTQLEELPPRRDLPFGKSDVSEEQQVESSAKEDRSNLNQAAENEDEETDDDDEL